MAGNFILSEFLAIHIMESLPLSAHSVWRLIFRCRKWLGTYSDMLASFMDTTNELHEKGGIHLRPQIRPLTFFQQIRLGTVYTDRCQHGEHSDVVLTT